MHLQGAAKLGRVILVKPEEYVDVGEACETEHGFKVFFEDLDARRVVLLSNQPHWVNRVPVSHRSSD
jgi:hypothetical protein